jgi:hypothetical protein
VQSQGKISISPIFLKESTKKDRYRSGFGGMGDRFDPVMPLID